MEKVLRRRYEVAMASGPSTPMWSDLEKTICHDDCAVLRALLLVVCSELSDSIGDSFADDPFVSCCRMVLLVTRITPSAILPTLHKLSCRGRSNTRSSNRSSVEWFQHDSDLPCLTPPHNLVAALVHNWTVLVSLVLAHHRPKQSSNGTLHHTVPFESVADCYTDCAQCIFGILVQVLRFMPSPCRLNGAPADSTVCQQQSTVGQDIMHVLRDIWSCQMSHQRLPLGTMYPRMGILVGELEGLTQTLLSALCLQECYMEGGERDSQMLDSLLCTEMNFSRMSTSSVDTRGGGDEIGISLQAASHLILDICSGSCEESVRTETLHLCELYDVHTCDVTSLMHSVIQSFGRHMTAVESTTGEVGVFPVPLRTPAPPGENDCIHISNGWHWYFIKATIYLLTCICQLNAYACGQDMGCPDMVLSTHAAGDMWWICVQLCLRVLDIMRQESLKVTRDMSMGGESLTRHYKDDECASYPFSVRARGLLFNYAAVLQATSFLEEILITRKFLLHPSCNRDEVLQVIEDFLESREDLEGLFIDVTSATYCTSRCALRVSHERESSACSGDLVKKCSASLVILLSHCYEVDCLLK